MIIDIPNYKNIEVNQTIDLNDHNICTLIGANGAGKSTLLESIFNHNNENIIVSFSSGQNELFTNIYKNIKRDTFKKIQNINSEIEEIKKYHFDYDFSRILIFLSCILKDGKVRKFLKENSYINHINNLELSLDFELPDYYVNAYQTALTQEAIDYNHYSIRNTYVNAYLERLIERKIDSEYDFDKKINKANVSLNASDILHIFEDKDILKIFTFISLTNNSATPIFNYKNNLLKFNDLEFEQLSDGEYQLLSIYAIIDLFDNQNTIFLLDEIDSHLHYTNIHKLWSTLKNISAKVITTTHSSESILNNSFNSLTYIENGILENELTAQRIFLKLSQVTGEKDYEYKIASKIKHIALLDDEVDWIIFKQLAIKKIGEGAEEILNKVIPYKRSSSFNTTDEIFGQSKLAYVKEFKNKNTRTSITKNIFLICDRDQFPSTQIDDNMCVNINCEYSDVNTFNHGNTKTHLLSWKMLEIENYLLSKTMLLHYNKFDELKEQLNHVNFDNIITFDTSEDLRKYDAKSILHPLYKDGGFDKVKLDEIIDNIPVVEISNDIVKMYEFIKSKVEN